MNRQDVLEELRAGRIRFAELEKRCGAGEAEKGDLRELADAAGKAAAELENLLPAPVYNPYKDFFNDFSALAENCRDIKFFEANRDTILAALEVFVESFYNMELQCRAGAGRCSCCKDKVFYLPSPDMYGTMRNNQLCSVCGRRRRKPPCCSSVPIRISEAGLRLTARRRITVNWDISGTPPGLTKMWRERRRGTAGGTGW